MTRFVNRSFIAVALGATLLTVGCSSSDDHADRHRTTSSDRSDRHYDDTRLSGDRYDARTLEIRGLSRDARIVEETRRPGDTLNFTPRDSGRVYLVDVTKSEVVWDKNIRDGDRVFVDPDHNKIAVNGRDDVKIDLKSNNRFQLYFDPKR
jgi:hypothetical protein